MKMLRAFVIIIALLAIVPAIYADTLTLKNGDHLSGTVVGTDGSQITFKTDAAGEIKIKWSSVQSLASDQPFYVATPDKRTVSGNITLEGSDLVVHTTTEGDVRVALAQLTVVRSVANEQAYEKSLHPGFFDNWSGGVNVGFALARGNSDTTNINTGFTADRKTLSDEIKAYASTIYSRNGATATGVPAGVTANEILGGAAFDRNITKRLFAFVSGDFTHDALQDLDIRAIFSGGLGWHVINTPNTTLDALFGINYTRESYSSRTVASVNRNLPGITAGENFVHKFASNTAFTETFDFYPDLSDISQYRFALDAAVVTKIKKWLGWQASVSDRYVTNPPIPGTKSNDLILSTGLNVSFGK